MEKLKKGKTPEKRPPPRRTRQSSASAANTETLRPEPVRKRRVSKYWIGLLALAIVLAIVIWALLGWLGRSLASYELHTPNHALNQYFQQLEAGAYDTLQPAAEAVFTPDENSGWEDYFAIIAARFSAPADSLTYRRTAARDLGENLQLYSVYSGDEKLGQVYLVPDEASESGWAVYATIDYLGGYTITAPSTVTVLMNGEALPQSSGTASGIDDIFGLLNDQSAVPAKTLTYQTEPTLNAPTFTATSALGGECTVDVDMETHTVTITAAPTAEQQQAYAEVLETTAKAYSDFITEDLTFSGLKPYLYPEAELYTNLQEYQWGWYLTHESREFFDVEISDLQAMSDTLFTGHIEFTVNVHRGAQLHVEKPSYDMAFINSNGQWLLCGIKVYHRE